MCVCIYIYIYIYIDTHTKIRIYVRKEFGEGLGAAKVLRTDILLHATQLSNV